MIIYEKENNGFYKVLTFITEKWKEGTISNLLFTLLYDNKNITAKFDTMYESDNGLEEDEKDYEEFNVILFEDQETKTLFELTYNSMPKEIYCGELKIL